MPESAENKPNVMEVNEANFEYAVLSASQARPVLVEFWAEWCAPCKTLAPLLEQLAAEYEGKFLLAKVNIDQAPLLAREFQIQNIPFMLLVKEGKIVDQFQGSISEEEVRRRLRVHVSSTADNSAERARALEAGGDLDGARAAYQAIGAADEGHPEVALGLARLALVQRRFDEAEGLLKGVDDTSPAAKQSRRHLDALAFWREAEGCGPEAECRQPAQAAPRDNEKQLRLAACLATSGTSADGKVTEGSRLQGARTQALEILLGIIERDRKFREGLARKAMLSLFGFLGEDSEETREFQSRMASVLY